MSIGSQIAKRRKQLGMTQQELAEKLAVSFQAVSLWERDENLPETGKLKLLAEALHTKVSFLMGEQLTVVNWEQRDEMFSPEHMLKRVRMYAQAGRMTETQKAMRIMLQYHEGAVRDSLNGKKIPYIIHPLLMACHAFALGIGTDDLIAVVLLHDMVEDTDARLEELDVNDTVKEAVDLLTKKKEPGREFDEDAYYAGIGLNRIAAMVKLLDRCNNISNMASGFNADRMAKYIVETEKYIFPLLEKVKYDFDEYYNAVFLIKYQLLSVMETVKWML